MVKFLFIFCCLSASCIIWTESSPFFFNIQQEFARASAQSQRSPQEISRPYTTQQPRVNRVRQNTFGFSGIFGKFFFPGIIINKQFGTTRPRPSQRPVVEVSPTFIPTDLSKEETSSSSPFSTTELPKKEVITSTTTTEIPFEEIDLSTDKDVSTTTTQGSDISELIDSLSSTTKAPLEEIGYSTQKVITAEVAIGVAAAKPTDFDLSTDSEVSTTSTEGSDFSELIDSLTATTKSPSGEIGYSTTQKVSTAEVAIDVAAAKPTDFDLSTDSEVSTTSTEGSDFSELIDSLTATTKAPSEEIGYSTTKKVTTAEVVIDVATVKPTVSVSKPELTGEETDLDTDKLAINNNKPSITETVLDLSTTKPSVVTSKPTYVGSSIEGASTDSFVDLAMTKPVVNVPNLGYLPASTGSVIGLATAKPAKPVYSPASTGSVIDLATTKPAKPVYSPASTGSVIDLATTKPASFVPKPVVLPASTGSVADLATAKPASYVPNPGYLPPSSGSVVDLATTKPAKPVFSPASTGSVIDLATAKPASYVPKPVYLPASIESVTNANIKPTTYRPHYFPATAQQSVSGSGSHSEIHTNEIKKPVPYNYPRPAYKYPQPEISAETILSQEIYPHGKPLRTINVNDQVAEVIDEEIVPVDSVQQVNYVFY